MLASVLIELLTASALLMLTGWVVETLDAASIGFFASGSGWGGDTISTVRPEGLAISPVLNLRSRRVGTAHHALPICRWAVPTLRKLAISPMRSLS